MRSPSLVPIAVPVLGAFLVGAVVLAFGLGVGQTSGWQPTWLQPASFPLLFEPWSVFGHALALAAFVLLLHEWARKHAWTRKLVALLERRDQQAGQLAAVRQECHNRLGTGARVESYREFYDGKVQDALRDINSRWLWYYILAFTVLVPALLGFFVNFHAPNAPNQVRPWKELALPLAVASSELVVVLLLAAFVHTRWASALATVADQLALFSHSDEIAPPSPPVREPKAIATPAPIPEHAPAKPANPPDQNGKKEATGGTLVTPPPPPPPVRRRTFEE